MWWELIEVDIAVGLYDAVAVYVTQIFVWIYRHKHRPNICLKADLKY